MTKAIVNAQGQITIPAVVRRALAVRVGDRIEFVEVESGEFMLVALNRSVTELKGMFGKPDRAVPIADMNPVTGSRELRMPER